MSEIHTLLLMTEVMCRKRVDLRLVAPSTQLRLGPEVEATRAIYHITRERLDPILWLVYEARLVS